MYAMYGVFNVTYEVHDDFNVILFTLNGLQITHFVISVLFVCDVSQRSSIVVECFVIG